ncbi:hypothetical protein [Halosimplex halophilum]|uniref:hypothetical protein n=1 Tax=Halosimplex halophilum TaxID=2559572 RepID=UPI00107F02B4|nr:hypothetical protein [Halosimplex halophilum]
MTVVTLAAVERAVAELAADGVEEVTSHDVAAHLDRSPLQWVHSSIGNQLSRLAEEGAIEKVRDGHLTDDKTTYRIVDADALDAEPQPIADGGATACEVCGGAVDDLRDLDPGDGDRVVCDGCTVEIDDATLAALREGIASTVAADDGRERRDGEFVFRARDDWSGAPGSHVVVDAAGGDYPNWAVVPFDLADLYLDELEVRLDDVDVTVGATGGDA